VLAPVGGVCTNSNTTGIYANALDATDWSWTPGSGGSLEWCQPYLTTP
jgi:hypothetical protein